MVKARGGDRPTGAKHVTRGQSPSRRSYGAMLPNTHGVIQMDDAGPVMVKHRQP